MTPAGKTTSGQLAAAPSAVPKASAVATPTPTPVAVAANNVPLQPFLTASPTPATSGRLEAWQTYRPGQMPRGRLLDVDQTAELADKGIGNATIYLRGDFTVTAVRDNRAVFDRVSLWPIMFSIAGTRVSSSNIRAEFRPPAREKPFSVQRSDPFKLMMCVVEQTAR